MINKQKAFQYQKGDQNYEITVSAKYDDNRGYHIVFELLRGKGALRFLVSDGVRGNNVITHFDAITSEMALEGIKHVYDRCEGLW